MLRLLFVIISAFASSSCTLLLVLPLLVLVLLISFTHSSIVVSFSSPSTAKRLLVCLALLSMTAI